MADRKLTPAPFRKKPIVVEAMQWDGNNADAIVQWVQGGWKAPTPFASQSGSMWIKQKLVDADRDECVWFLVIPTLEGDQEASPGDWIIRGFKGEFYPCKPDIFEATYETADDADTAHA